MCQHGFSHRWRWCRKFRHLSTTSRLVFLVSICIDFHRQSRIYVLYAQLPHQSGVMTVCTFVQLELWPPWVFRWRPQDDRRVARLTRKDFCVCVDIYRRYFSFFFVHVTQKYFLFVCFCAFTPGPYFSMGVHSSSALMHAHRAAWENTGIYSALRVRADVLFITVFKFK